MRYLLAFLLLMPLMSRAGDKSPYVLDTLRQVHDLEAESFMLEDPDNEYRYEDIVAGRMDQAFIPLVQGKKTSEHYWIRFKVYVSTPVKNWILTLKENGNIIAMNDRLESFIVQDGQVILNDKAGRLVPRSQKLVRRTAGFNGLDFSIPVAGLYTVYIKISNTFSGSFEVSRPVIQQAEIANEPQGRALMTRLLNIISIMFCLLSLFFYFFVKERAYLLFGIYCFMLSQHYLILHSDAPFNDIYMPEYPLVATGFWHILTVGGFICFCLFGSAFMNLRQLSKNLHRYFMLYLAIWAALIIIESIYYVRTQQQLFPSYTLLVYGMITLYFFIRFAFLKSILARLFVGGALWLLCFTFLGALWGNEVINMPFNPWPVGQVGQLLIFAAALAYKVRLNEKARAESMRIRDMDEIKSRFFANISHEFRTPLTLIQGPLQQIESDAKKNDSNVMVPMRHVKTMRRNTDRLLELVNQLLDLSK
ncbi:MAG: histidine kinase dimerization/phospho-acceptor domain-containing protein, partial [Flavisolibacter sp.]